MLLESMPNHIKVINNNVIQDQISQISSTTSISLATLFFIIKCELSRKMSRYKLDVVLYGNTLLMAV